MTAWMGVWLRDRVIDDSRAVSVTSRLIFPFGPNFRAKVPDKSWKNLYFYPGSYVVTGYMVYGNQSINYPNIYGIN